MSADKYPCIFSRQMETIVYISANDRISRTIDSALERARLAAYFVQE